MHSKHTFAGELTIVLPAGLVAANDANNVLAFVCLAFTIRRRGMLLLLLLLQLLLLLVVLLLLWKNMN
jgi:hypothetical protein